MRLAKDEVAVCRKLAIFLLAEDFSISRSLCMCFYLSVKEAGVVQVQ